MMNGAPAHKPKIRRPVARVRWTIAEAMARRFDVDLVRQDGIVVHEAILPYAQASWGGRSRPIVCRCRFSYWLLNRFCGMPAAENT